MKSVVSAAEYRRLIILDVLLRSKDPVSKDTLRMATGSTLNTLKQDIVILNDIFPEGVANIVEEDKKWYLSTGMDINFDYLIAYMLTKSDLFEISVSIFNDEQLYPEDWIAKKFVGLTSYYAKLKEMDKYLAKTRLILNNSPLKILGQEMNIRFHFSYLFSKSYPDSGWVIKDFDFEVIDRFIKSMESNLHIFFSWTARIDYAIAIGVSLTRIKQGYPIELNEEDKYIDVFEEYYDISKMDFSSLEDALGASLSKKERQMLILISSLGVFTYLDHTHLEARLNYLEQYRPERYEIGLALATIIKDQVMDFAAVLIAVLDYMTRFTFVEKKYIIMDVDYFSKQQTPDTQMKQDVIDVLTGFEKKPGYTYLRDNKSIIVSHINDLFRFILLNEIEAKRLHVKVISKNGYFWEAYLKSEIRKHYTEELLVFSDDLKPREHEPNCDLILSDFPLNENIGKEVLVWHVPPTKRDLLRLKSFVYPEK